MNDMRRIQWERLPDVVVKETIWLKKIQTASKSESMENKFDEKGVFRKIEQRFCVKKIGAISTEKEDGENVQGKAEKTIIDSKKAQNISKLLI